MVVEEKGATIKNNGKSPSRGGQVRWRKEIFYRMIKKLPTKVFSNHTGALVDQPNLVEIQTQSYNWFLKGGLTELFEESFPMKDYAGKDIELKFVDFFFDEPKYD